MEVSKIEENDEEYITYRIQNQISIKIFGDHFVRNNKDKFKIIYENKEYDLLTNLEVDKNKKILKIKLLPKENTKITDMGHMFDGCSSLTSLPDIFK